MTIVLLHGHGRTFHLTADDRITLCGRRPDGIGFAHRLDPKYRDHPGVKICSHCAKKESA